jgi:virulence-associated protein VapD
LSILLAVLLLSTANAQNNDCKNFKTGKFKITANGSTVYIDRTKETQIETVDDGTRIILKIKWIDDCTYTLQFVKYASNPNNMPLDTEMILTVKITSISKESYFQETTSDKFKEVFKSEVKKLSN